jgi:DNA-binding NarL/FixJ family response regulator
MGVGHAGRRPLIEEAAEAICREYGWSLEDITSESREEEIVAMRALLIDALLERGYSPEEIARCLNRSPRMVYYHLEKKGA